ncbi:50S ribosomal protein L10 [candidate division LCP-89 bacterium B3_LCP]|uniref:Large ribosomal subunit protein uL10 n=1 Tax=candidate division LCP-89 bacterium B3_LCP TaxID=2012998 RepID=A0A532V0E4_UNCL8|nr:MAG: 50S ribosomal protein L10 [candidate division LCP-89 bacterium B3_LCP]
MNTEAHPTQKKVETVEELTELLEKAQGLYLADFTGLNVKEANQLRRDFRGNNAIYRVYKNTLLEHACRKVGFDELIQHLEGPTALALSMEDPVAPVRIIADFVKGKDKETPVIKAGILEKNYLDADRIKPLKNIPPREILLAQIFSSMEAPVTNFVMVLNEIVRSFLGVIQAVVDKKNADGGGEAEAS